MNKAVKNSIRIGLTVLIVITIDFITSTLIDARCPVRMSYEAGRNCISFTEWASNSRAVILLFIGAFLFWKSMKLELRTLIVIATITTLFNPKLSSHPLIFLINMIIIPIAWFMVGKTSFYKLENVNLEDYHEGNLQRNLFIKSAGYLLAAWQLFLLFPMASISSREGLGWFLFGTAIFIIVNIGIALMYAIISLMRIKSWDKTDKRLFIFNSVIFVINALLLYRAVMLCY